MKQIEHFFPTPIASIRDVDMAEKMLPIAKKYLADKKHLSNEWGYKNTYKSNGGLNEYKDFDEFTNWIHDQARWYLNELGYKCPNEFSTQIFASEMLEGDKHGPHTHPNSILSGVFYLQAPEGSSKILFNDPKPYRKYIDLEVENNTLHNYHQVFFNAEKGLLVLWQSWIEHEVPENKSQEGRITLVFNLGDKPL